MAGYLALINYVDEFIILDDVQFSKEAAATKRIKQNNKELFNVSKSRKIRTKN